MGRICWRRDHDVHPAARAVVMPSMTSLAVPRQRRCYRPATGLRPPPARPPELVLCLSDLRLMSLDTYMCRPPNNHASQSN